MPQCYSQISMCDLDLIRRVHSWCWHSWIDKKRPLSAFILVQCELHPWSI
jgi:hypothetical protein